MTRIGDIDLVVVGADAFVPSGFVNKVGTSVLARLARQERKPFFVMAESSKILPRSLARFYRLPLGREREIVRSAKGIRVENPYFDCTPWRFATAIFTENGEASREQLTEEMRSVPVSKRLVEVLEQRCE